MQTPNNQKQAAVYGNTDANVAAKLRKKAISEVNIGLVFDLGNPRRVGW